MTVPSTVNRNDYVGNGATTVYPYTFQIFNQSHLEVWTQSVAGVVTKLTITTDYTVSDVGLSGGGNVTLNSALASNYLLAIKLVLPLTQLTDLKNQGQFFAEVHERVFDRDIRITQQLADQNARSIKLPETEIGTALKTTIPVSSLRASKLLGFDEDGNIVVLYGADNQSITDAVALTAADAVATAADRVQTGLDAVATAADRVQTGLDAVATAADRVQTGTDVIAAASARDAALIQAGVYTTEPLGRAAVADGVAFKVQGSGEVAAYEYRRVDASSSTLIATYPSSAALSFVDRSTEYFVYGGQVLEAIVDSAGRSLAAWLADGILRAKFGLEVDSTSPITLTFSPTTGLTTVSLTTASLLTAEQYIGANKVIGGLTDANLRAYLAMFEDGRTYIPKLLVDTLTSTGVITATAVTLSGVDLATMFSPETAEQYIGNNKVIGSLTDVNRCAYLAMFESGQTYIPKLTVDTLTVGGATVNNTVNSVHQSDFVIYGDSLSIPGGSSGFSQAFAALYPTRTTYIQGVSGQQSWDIAARVGMGVTCSVAGGVIPTSGSVTLSGWSGPTTVYGVLGSANAGIYAANARLYGVAGVLSVDATNTHTFTPSSYPAATRPVPAACPLQITGQTVYGTTDTSSSLTLDVQNSAIAILWLGRNDFRYAGYSQAATLENIAAAYAQLKNVHRRVLVLGTINGEYELTAARSPTVGGSPSDAETQRRLDANAALRVALSQTYGDNYLGMQEALEVAGYAGSWTISGTTYQILNNTLLPDGVHPTGNQSIIAGIVQSRITAKGW